MVYNFLWKARSLNAARNAGWCARLVRTANRQITVILFLMALAAQLALASSCPTLIPVAPGPAPNVKDPSPGDCGSMLVEDDPSISLTTFLSIFGHNTPPRYIASPRVDGEIRRAWENIGFALSYQVH